TFNGGANLTTVSATTICEEPLEATGICLENGQAVFTVTNSNGDMTEPQTYTITDENGNIVASGSIQLRAGESISIPVTGVFGPLTFNTSSDLIAVSTTTVCEEPPVVCPEFPPLPREGTNGFPIIDMSTGCPDATLIEHTWTPVEVGSA